MGLIKLSIPPQIDSSTDVEPTSLFMMDALLIARSSRAMAVYFLQQVQQDAATNAEDVIQSHNNHNTKEKDISDNEMTDFYQGLGYYK